MIGRAIRDDIKAAQAFSQSRFILGVNLNREDASAAEFCGQRLRSLQIGVGNDYLLKIASAREIASRFRTHRATAPKNYDPHDLISSGVWWFEGLCTLA